MKFIDLFDNVGDSLVVIHNNLNELDSLVCNLQGNSYKWADAFTYLKGVSAHWSQSTALFENLSSKWDTFANLIFSFSGIWEGTTSYIYPHPFVEGSVNLGTIKNFVNTFIPARNQPNNKKISIFYFIQNYAAIPTQTNNIFQKSVSSVCYKNIENAWVEVDCAKNGICPLNLCDDLFKNIDINSAYDCFNCVERFYYLIDV